MISQKYFIQIISYGFAFAIPVLMLTRSPDLSTAIFFFSLFALPILILLWSAGPLHAAGIAVFACLVGMVCFLFSFSWPDLMRGTPLIFLLQSAFFISLLWQAQKFIEKKNLEAQQIKEDVENLEVEIAKIQQQQEDLENFCAGISKKIEKYSQLEFFTDQVASSLKVREIREKTELTIKLLLTGTIQTAAELCLFETQDSAENSDTVGTWIVQHKIPLFIEDYSQDVRFPELRLSQKGSLIACPLERENSIMGLLKVEAGSPGIWKEEDVRFLADISNVVALSITNAVAYDKVEALAVKDSLTGLFVRYRFDERLEEEFSKAKQSRLPLTLLLFDLDYFKAVNDRWGHAAGDAVLKDVAASVMQTTRETDFCARYGGEEIAVIMPFTELENAFKIADRIRKNIAEKTIGEEKLQITVSGGIASALPGMKNFRELISSADRALYSAKEMGRNRIVRA